MRFMMIVKATKESETGKPFNPALMAAIQKSSQELMKSGVMIATGGLQPSSKGARIRVSGQKLFVMDGPFAETKELIGGFAILEAKSREEAIELGRAFMQIHADTLGPSYEGEIEIRPMMEVVNGQCVQEDATAELAQK
jgi:hypothetical protein